MKLRRPLDFHVLERKRRARLDATAEWQAIAQGPDVLYSVTGWPGKQGAWTADDFYASGQSDWDDFRRHWSHYWPELGGTCLEIGCGPGRLTHALAEDFSEVIAVDVSADMIERARQVCPESVELHQVSGSRLPAPDASVDAVFSIHVFQHLEDEAAVRAYLAEAWRVLRPGGSLLVHIWVTSRTRSRMQRTREEVRLWRSRRALARGKEHFSVRMRVYGVEQTYELLTASGFTDLELRIVSVRSNGSPHSLWLARRPVAVLAGDVE